MYIAGGEEEWSSRETSKGKSGEEEDKGKEKEKRNKWNEAESNKENRTRKWGRRQ
jgi:hypothetical protein